MLVTESLHLPFMLAVALVPVAFLVAALARRAGHRRLPTAISLCSGVAAFAVGGDTGYAFIAGAFAVGSVAREFAYRRSAGRAGGYTRVLAPSPSEAD